MDRRGEKRILIIITVFYILVALLAVCILNLSGSIFAKRGEVDLKGHFLSIWNRPDDDAVEMAEETDPMDKLQGLEALDEASEIVSEPAAREMPEEVTEPPAPSESAPEEPVSETVSEPEVPEEHFYSFKTNNTDTRLRMRREPGEDAKIIYELKPGSTGYVIELGDDWSKVAAYGHEGYCANEFLTMTEITEEEYRELVESHDKAAKSSKGSGKKETAGAVNAAAAADALNAAAQAAQAADAAESQAGGTAPADGAADAAPAEAE